MLDQPNSKVHNTTDRSLQLVLDFVLLAFCEKQPRAAFEGFVPMTMCNTIHMSPPTG